MTTVIAVEGLAKEYTLGEHQAAYGTLRESLVHAGRRLTGREHKGHGEKIWALTDVSLEVQQGEVLGVIGPNGAGKSTLFNLISGHYAPTSGQILLNGVSIAGFAPHIINRLGLSPGARTRLRKFSSTVMLAKISRSSGT